MVRHYKRTIEALNRIEFASRTGQGPFEDYRVPQECRNYPENIESDLDIANYLFNTMLHMSGRNGVNTAMKGHRCLYERFPELYDSFQCVQHSEGDIREKMQSVGLTLTESRPKWMLHNAGVLNEYWRGDPRNIFAGLPKDTMPAWEEIKRRTLSGPQKLMGYQDKMAALLGTLFVEADLIEQREIPPAIDIHHCRMFGSLGLIGCGDVVGPWKEFKDYREKIRQMYFKFSSDNGVSMNDVGVAVWYYSLNMCKYASKANKDFYETGELSKIYARTCGKCIVSDMCTKVMPQDYHYTGKGGLHFIPRLRPEGEEPLAIDWDAPEKARCTRHMGKYFLPDKTEGCIDCGECGKPVGLPMRIQKITLAKEALRLI